MSHEEQKFLIILQISFIQSHDTSGPIACKGKYLMDFKTLLVIGVGKEVL